MKSSEDSKILGSTIELKDASNFESIVKEQKQMPQYASVQKPSHNQQSDQFLVRIQQSTHCRNCKCYYECYCLIIEN